VPQSRRSRCRDCNCQFNERRGGVLNRTSLPSDIIAFVVSCRLRYRLTLRDLSEILLLRGIEVSHEAVRDWETKLLPIMGEELRKRRHEKRRGPGASWYVEETYLKVRGKWAYLYRAIDRDGNLIDAMLKRAPQSGGRQSLLPFGKGDDRLSAGPSDDRRPWLLSPGNPHDARTNGPTQDKRPLK
jgi:DDE domain